MGKKTPRAKGVGQTTKQPKRRHRCRIRGHPLPKTPGLVTLQGIHVHALLGGARKNPPQCRMAGIHLQRLLVCDCCNRLEHCFCTKTSRVGANVLHDELAPSILQVLLALPNYLGLGRPDQGEQAGRGSLVIAECGGRDIRPGTTCGTSRSAQPASSHGLATRPTCCPSSCDGKHHDALPTPMCPPKARTNLAPLNRPSSAIAGAPP